MNDFLLAPQWDIDAVMERVETDIALRAKAKREHETAASLRRAAKCRAATGVLLKALTPVTVVLKQLLILGSYLWQLAKARKTGFCPYLRFHD